MNTRSFKISGLGIIVCFLVAGIALGRAQPESRSAGERGRLLHDQQRVVLHFRKVSPRRLFVSKPKSGWRKAKTITFWDLTAFGKDDYPQESATIVLFVDPAGKGVAAGDVYAFLQDGSALRDLGQVGSYGVNGVSVAMAKLTDWPGDELVIQGGLGAASGLTEVLGFDREADKWVCLLKLEGDATRASWPDSSQVILERSAGGLPAGLQIYRWGVDHFEVASVTEATRDGAATYIPEKGTIRSDRLGADGETIASEYYSYSAGVLVPVPREQKVLVHLSGLCQR